MLRPDKAQKPASEPLAEQSRRAQRRMVSKRSPRREAGSIHVMMQTAPIATLAVVLPAIALANDFPTQARVEFVLGCMNEQGGQTYDTLYQCVCLIDKIAAEMSYKEFSEAQVFSQLRSTPGERGGVFRDPEQAGSLRDKLEGAIARGKAACFVRK